jgi:hypothetical protein
MASTQGPKPTSSKIAKMTGGAGGGLGRIQKSAAAPGKGAGKGGKTP